MAKLPLRVLRALPGGGSAVDPQHPLNAVLQTPNRWQTSFDFWRYVVTSLALRGNGFAAILRDGAGNPRALVPLNPDRVTVLVSPKGWIYYLVSHPLVGEGITLHQDDVIHLRGMSLDGGISGVSPIAFEQDLIGIALATQRHGARLFANGAQLSGVLTTEQTLSNEAAARIADSWQASYGGVENSNRTAVLEAGLRYEKIAMTSQDAQFLETQQYTAVKICSIFRVPPHKIMQLNFATFSNIENQNQQYIDDALMPIGVAAEQRMEHALLFEDERRRFSLSWNYDALLRGDMTARYTAHGIGIDKGFLTPDEARIAEKMVPRGGAADELRFPMNTTPDGSALPAPAASGG